MKTIHRISLLATAALLPGVARAQLVISDTLTGVSSSYNWQALNGACLTAGNGTGSIPACSGLGYYSGKTQVGGTSGRLPDQPGSGALRLTNGDTQASGNGVGTNGNNQTGAVVSNFTFPTNQGLQVTFTTVTYGGNAYKNASGVKSGADGISFFLADGSQPATVGALGGSLGYSCSNGNSTYDGVQGGYIGLGIDEYGNFSNAGDNTSSGPGAIPGRISLRGAGNTNWANLSNNYPQYYPSPGLSVSRSTAVQKTCRAGYLYNFSGDWVQDAHGQWIADGTQTTESIPYNYNYVTGDTLSSVTIFNQQGINNPTRGAATPITYGLTITQDGLLSLSYSVNGGAAQPVITKQSITASNGPLPASFRFGFSAGTGGGSNVHEITCFKASPINQSNSSAGTNTQQSQQVQVGTQLYLGYYHPINWWGQLTALSVVKDPVTGIDSISSVANWDASCVLTGGACPSMGASATVAAQAPTARSILTWNGTTGIPFQWSSLTSAQQTALTAGDSSASSARLAYLRGDRSYEYSNGGSYRSRDSVLGDIINSSPTWVGGPSSPYNGPWVDSLYAKASAPETAGSYASFTTKYGQRQNVVYVGANDGMLHGFRSGSYDANGKFVNNATTPNDGLEVLAYMPATVLNTIHSTNSKVDFSATSYAHNLFVDATPGTGDLYYNGAWHTWLVGGLGGGGNAGGPIGDNSSTGGGAIYALDVTNPSSFSEGNASALVLGEWTPSNILCANVTGCGKYLGNTYGTPVIRRLHNGYWAVLFGNGLNSQNGTAGMYIMLVNPANGATSFYYLDTGYGPSKDPTGSNNKNGIAYVTPADLDGDHITDYVYAGDLFGNVWRFDLTSQNPASWSVSSAPLFSTSPGQPISTKVIVAAVPGAGTGQPRVLVSFGTGQALPATLSSAATYASGTQALYGIWDWNMNAWNAMAPTSAQYASLAAPQSVTVSSLVAQKITTDTTASGSTPSVRVVTSNSVCWKGGTSCASNNQYGWTLPFSTKPGEQIVYNPTLQFGVFNVNTLIPSVQQILSCSSTPASGYSMGVSIATGGATSSSYFLDINGNAYLNNGAVVSGIGFSAVGTSLVLRDGNVVYMAAQSNGGGGSGGGGGGNTGADWWRINPGAAGTGSRLNWVKLR